MVVTTLVYLAARYDVVTVDLDVVSLDLVPVHEVADLDPRGLLAVTNGGLFHAPDRPVGWTVAADHELAPLQLGDGAGNFFLRPNGVFWVDERGAHVADSRDLRPVGRVRLATQSGPALVLAGRIHPAFSPTSTSLKVRNAVGVLDDHTVVLVKSRDPVRFWDLASLFVDELRVRDALYLDGTISGLWAPGLVGGGSGPADQAYATLLVVRGDPASVGSCTEPR